MRRPVTTWDASGENHQLADSVWTDFEQFLGADCAPTQARQVFFFSVGVAVRAQHSCAVLTCQVRARGT